MFVSTEGKRVDIKKVKELIGTKVSIAKPKVLTEQTGFVPGAACSFGNSKDISLIVDRDILKLDTKFLFSPGPPTKKSLWMEKTLVRS